MSLVLEKMISDSDYTWCDEENRYECNVDGYACQSCICVKLLAEHH